MQHPPFLQMEDLGLIVHIVWLDTGFVATRMIFRDDVHPDDTDGDGGCVDDSMCSIDGKTWH